MTKEWPVTCFVHVCRYVGGLSDEVVEQDLKDHFYPFGEITSVKVSFVLRLCLQIMDQRGLMCVCLMLPLPMVIMETNEF
jgi:hypothetical protein